MGLFDKLLKEGAEALKEITKEENKEKEASQRKKPISPKDWTVEVFTADSVLKNVKKNGQQRKNLLLTVISDIFPIFIL